MPSTRARFAKALRWVAGPAALLGLLAWVSGGPGPAKATSRPDVAATPEAAPSFAASALGSVPKADLSPAARLAALADTRRIVEERNREAAKDRAAFAADGWQMVRAEAPDARVVSLDPALLGEGRETDLRVQIASTVGSPAQAGKLADIARRAREEETRVAAVEALGRIAGAEAQRSLYDLLVEGGLDAEDPARRAIAPLLRPTDLDDPYAARLAAQLDSDKLTAVERKQIAFTLALVGLRDGMELPPATLASLSPRARELVAAMTALATQSNPASP